MNECEVRGGPAGIKRAPDDIFALTILNYCSLFQIADLFRSAKGTGTFTQTSTSTFLNAKKLLYDGQPCTTATTPSSRHYEVLWQLYRRLLQI